MKRLIFIVTNRCNFSCPICLRTKNEESLDINLAKKIVTQAKGLRFEQINITGGEPCCYPNLDEFIDLIVKCDLKFTIVSNGYEYGKYAQYLDRYHDNFQQITFSLDSHFPETHDNIRNREGSFDKVIEGINYFSEKDLIMQISMCLGKENKDHLGGVVELAHELKVDRIKILTVIPTEGNRHLVLSDEERADCIEEISEIKKTSSIEIYWLSSLCTDGGIEFCNGLNLSELTVMPTGNLKFCCDIVEEKGVLGSLKKKKLNRLIKRGETVSKLLKEVRRECIYEDELFEGFDTCAFCNEFLK